MPLCLQASLLSICIKSWFTIVPGTGQSHPTSSRQSQHFRSCSSSLVLCLLASHSSCIAVCLLNLSDSNFALLRPAQWLEFIKFGKPGLCRTPHSKSGIEACAMSAGCFCCNYSARGCGVICWGSKPSVADRCIFVHPCLYICSKTCSHLTVTAVGSVSLIKCTLSKKVTIVL